MKTAEPKTTSGATAQKANRPFFSKEAEGSFFGESKHKESSFFKPSSTYSLNGNGVLQTKLTIGQPNDKYEQEADATADKVVQRLATPDVLTKKETTVQAKPISNSITPIVQAKCASCEDEDKLQKKEEEDLVQESSLDLQRKPIFESNAEPQDDENTIQRKCAECEMEERIQKKSDSSDSQSASSSIESSLNSSKGSGSPLPQNTRQQMESSFGADFSNVRLHTDSSAVQMNKGLHAQAFTHGSDIYFNSGKYDTGSAGGKHLLAHELTHVVQQGNSVSKKSSLQKPKETIQCAPLAGFVPAVTEKQKRYFSHRNDVVDIQGQSTFNPPSGLANYISSLWENSQEAAVNIKFGSLGQGYVFFKPPVSYTSKPSCIDILKFGILGPVVSICKDIPPLSENYQARLHVLPVHHDALKQTDTGSTVLTVQIVNGIIYCKLGEVKGKKFEEIDSVMDAESVQTNEEAFLPLIYGTEYDGTNYTSADYQNLTIGGELFFHSIGEIKLPNQQKIQGIFIINNERHQWFGNLTGQPKGLEIYDVPIKRSSDATLTGDATGLTLDANWTGGSETSEQGKFTAYGQLRISYQNGILDIFGKATYRSARIKGEVNIAVTKKSKAQELFAQHAPATKSKGAGTMTGPLPASPEENQQEQLALTAWGKLSFKLIDTKKATAGKTGKKHPLTDLEGEGAFAVSPEGYIILAGKLKFPTKWLLTSELNYRSDDADDKSKHLFEHEQTLARAKVPYGTANLKLGITIDADAHLDPLELYEIETGGVYSNHPDYRSEVELTPHFYISGNAGAKVIVIAEGAYKLGGLIKVITATGELSGEARANAYIDAAPTIKKIWEGGDMPATYGIDGVIHTGGKITFRLTGSINVRVLGGKIWKTDDYEIGSWTLREFGAILKMNEYIIGSGEVPALDYSSMGFSTKERKRLGNAIAKETENGSGVDDKRTGGFEQTEDGKQKEKGTFSETEPRRPDKDAEPITNTLEEDFLMKDKLHELTLSFSGTRKTPSALIEMASGEKKPLSKKIAEEKSILEAEKFFVSDEIENELETREKDIEAIEIDAVSVTQNAIGAAQKVLGDEEPDVAGFDQLDDRLNAYSKKYNTDDIGIVFGTSKFINPVTLPTIHVPRVVGADPKLEQLLTDKRVEVGYSSFDNFKSSNVAVFRYYILKPGAKKIDSSADGPFYETAVNVAKELHSEQIIAGNLQAIHQSKEFREKYGPTHIIAVNHVLSERSPCSMCRDFLVNNPSKLILTSNEHTYYLVHYSGDWIKRNRALMLRYGLQPPSLQDLKKSYGGRNQDPH